MDRAGAHASCWEISIVSKNFVSPKKAHHPAPSGGAISSPVTEPGSEFLDALHDMCFLLLPDGTIRTVNRRVTDVLAREPGTLIGTPFGAIVDDAHRVEVMASIAQCLRDGVRVVREAVFLSAVGSQVCVQIFLSRYAVDRAEHAPVCLVLARDISGEKQRELDLLRFSNIAHFTVNPLEITDVNGRLIYVNPAFERASGFSKEELIGQNPNVFGSGKHSPAFWKRVWDTISAGKVWMGEVENMRRNGDPFITHLLISPIVDAKGKVVGYFGVHRDITEQRALEQQLIQAQKMESIGMLAAGIAHEVGNPLASISSIVQVIQRTTRDDFTKEKLELIKSQVTRISKIIRDLVDFSRRSNYEVQLTDVNRRVREAVEIVRVGKKAKEIFIITDLDDSIPPLPLVPDQIEQVFINILINAVDAIYSNPRASERYIDEQSRRRITVITRAVQGRMQISIEDNGCGISEDDLPKIFEPFFTTKSIGEGTGLGLWVSYGIVKSFHGTIHVKSTEDQGTTFTITLPIHPELNPPV